MKKKYVRVGFTQAQKTELWERWRRGEQIKSIGRELCNFTLLDASSVKPRWVGKT